MSDFICPESLNWSCILNQTSGPPPTPLYVSPAYYIALLAQPVAAVLVWFLIRLRNLRPLEELEFPDRADQIPPIAAPQLPEEQPQPQPPQPQTPAVATPLLPAEQPRCGVTSTLDANQVAAATDAIRRSMEENIRIRSIIPALRPPQPDGSGSSSSDDERNHRDEYFQYPSVEELEAGDVDLIVPNSMEPLQEMIKGLPEAGRVEMVRRAFREAEGLCRLSNVLENPWILRAETFADPCELTKKSTRIWVMKLKITTKLLCLMRRKLDGQSWQLCQELKEECFAEVAGQSVEKLLNVARSFSNAMWSAGHILQMLTIFDTLVDVLYNIRNLSFNRSELIPSEVAEIFQKMVDAFGEILATTNGMHSRKESTIHPATVVLIRVQEFFHRNTDMLQSILAPGNHTIDLHSPMIDCWVSKLKKDAEGIFPDEKDRQYIFVLNNTCYVRQNCRSGLGGFLPNVEVVDRFDKLIQEYIESYLAEYWAPILSHLEGGSRSSLDKFTNFFFSICDRQMKWKVQTELKMKLRGKIDSLIVPPYDTFSGALPANPSSKWLSLLKGVMPGIRKKELKNYTVNELKDVIGGLFER